MSECVLRNERRKKQVNTTLRWWFGRCKWLKRTKGWKRLLLRIRDGIGGRQAVEAGAGRRKRTGWKGSLAGRFAVALSTLSPRPTTHRIWRFSTTPRRYRIASQSILPSCSCLQNYAVMAHTMRRDATLLTTAAHYSLPPLPKGPRPKAPLPDVGSRPK
jgi:hypothetical protein